MASRTAHYPRQRESGAIRDKTRDDDVNGPNADCSETGTACKLRVTGVFAPGTYTFTLKAGAQIEDLLGNVYTHPADTVRTFTVANDPPSPGAQCL